MSDFYHCWITYKCETHVGSWKICTVTASSADRVKQLILDVLISKTTLWFRRIPLAELGTPSFESEYAHIKSGTEPVKPKHLFIELWISFFLLLIYAAAGIFPWMIL